MTQDEKWIARYNEVVAFIETNKRNPSKYDAMDFGFGGFLGYGKTMPVSVALDEELMTEVRRKM